MVSDNFFERMYIMSQVPTPVTPDFAKLMDATLKLGLSTLAEFSALSMKNGTLLTEMVNPHAALPALSQATSRMLHAQVDIGLSSLEYVSKTFEETVRVAESLPLGKESMGPIPARMRDSLQQAKDTLSTVGRQTGKAFAF